MAGNEMNNIGALAANVIQLQDRTVKPVPTKRMNDKPSTHSQKNYIVLPWRAATDKRINKTAAFIVLAVVCGYTNRHGETWVGQKTLGDILGVSQQAIAKQIKKLVDFGYIQILQKAGKAYSARMRVVFDTSLTIEEVKTNTPAAFRDDAPAPQIPSKETAIERINNMKNILKGRQDDTTQ